MRHRAGAFATLVAVGLLILSVALSAIAGDSLGELLGSRRRAEADLESRAEEWSVLSRVLEALDSTWNVESQTIDGWWATHRGDFGAATALVSLSGRVNLDWASPFLLAIQNWPRL